MTDQNRVLIVGSGMMGTGIAACAALAGHPTVLFDTSLACAQAGVERAAGHVAQLQASGLAEPEQAQRAVRLLEAGEQVADFVDRACLIIEAITENLPRKQELFAELDRLAPPEVIIASNTSGLRITEISAHMQHPERAVTAHFWFPAHLVPLVEVVMGDRTDEPVALRLRDLLRRWGKAPVLVRRDLPGQLANRIYQAMMREASNIVQLGLASAEDVDTALKMGLGLRLPAWGVLEHMDAVGLDLVFSTQTTVLPGINNEPGPTQLLRDLVAAGKLGYKTGQGFYNWQEKDMAALAARRDRFIVAALRILREQERGG